jgi:hypothetical protein
MKRALLLLPVLALLIGLLLFLLRPSQEGSGPGRSGPDSVEAAIPSASADHDHASPAAPRPVDPSLTGAIKFVITSQGQPVKDAKITAQKDGTPDYMKFTTEADGTQLLRGMPAVEFSFYVEHPDYIPETAELRVEPNKTTELRVDLKRGGRIYGTVTDQATGRPIPQARIFLLAQYEGTAHPRALPATAVTSDEKGQYQIKAIPPTMVGIRFRHNRYEPLDRLDLLFNGPTDEYRVDVALTLGQKITGRVVDEQGKPIAGAHLMASNFESAMTGYSAQDGTFDIGGLFHKSANCQASMKGYGKVIMRNLPVDGPPVEFRLPKAGSLIGKVVADAPLPEFQIVLNRYDEEFKQVVPAESKQFQKSPGNVFNLEDIAPGAYWVEIQVEGYEAVDRPQVQVIGGQITEGATITLRKKD